MMARGPRIVHPRCVRAVCDPCGTVFTVKGASV